MRRVYCLQKADSCYDAFFFLSDSGRKVPQPWQRVWDTGPGHGQAGREGVCQPTGHRVGRSGDWPRAPAPPSAQDRTASLKPTLSRDLGSGCLELQWQDCHPAGSLSGISFFPPSYPWLFLSESVSWKPPTSLSLAAMLLPLRAECEGENEEKGGYSESFALCPVVCEAGRIRPDLYYVLDTRGWMWRTGQHV